MKIAILADALDLQYAGIHVFLREWLKALTRLDKRNEYFLVRPCRGGEFEGVEEIIVPIRRGIPAYQRWRLFTSIPRRLVEAGVDVVVEPAHFGPFNLPPHIRRVTVIHDLTPLLFPQFHPLASSWSHRLLLPGIVLKADRILVNSECTRQDVERCFPLAKGKTSVMLPGREDVFRPMKNSAVLQKYGIREPYLLTVGTIEPRKNLGMLLLAYEAFRQASGQAFQWVLVGKRGWKNEAFFERLEKSPFRSDVVLTGYVERSEMAALYTAATLFVYPSLYEGFGLPVLEAMSCGAPALISNASSLPEVGGAAAEYFDPKDAEGLSQKLLELTGDEGKRQAMSAASLRRAADFSWDAAARKFAGVLGDWQEARKVP